MSGHVQDLLSAYLDGELSLPERAMVEAHLAACAACAERLEDFATLDTTLRALPVEPPAGYFDDFPARVRERVRGRATPAASWRVPVWGWAAAAAAILAILTPLTLERARLSPAPGQAVAPAAAPRASGGESAPARQVQAAGDETPEPRASEALRSAPYANGRGSPGEAVSAPRPASEPPPIAAPQPEQAAAPDMREGQLRQTGAGAPLPVTPQAEVRREADAPRLALQHPAEERLGGLGSSSPGDPGLASSPPAPRASAASVSRPAGSNASREDAPAETPAAPKAEAAFARPAPAPAARAADTERDAAEADRKDKAGAEAEGGARGRLAGTGAARARDDAADDEFAALRGRAASGAATLDQARALRDDWRSFAARNPSGARGDEARFQVIEAGYRAWRLGRDARDRAVLARDAHTYLDRAAGAHAERVRTILLEAERE